MNQTPYTSLQRQPSASQSAPDHQRSSPSLGHSPNQPGSDSGNPSQPDPYNSRNRYSARQSFEDRVADGFNAHPGVLSSLDSTKASGYQNSLRRPGPPPLSYTTTNAKIMSPSLRQSASFSMGDRTGTDTSRSDSEGGSAASKRYSDDANGSKNPASRKKKSGISSFIGSVLGSPRSNSVKISAPENPVHVTHVGFDNQTGQFTVCPTEL